MGEELEEVEWHDEEEEVAGEEVNGDDERGRERYE